MRPSNHVPARTLHAGVGRGPVLELSEPLNLWGGLDPRTGQIVHPQHPQRGHSIANTVLLMPASRGSGTNAQIFAHVCGLGNAPAAVVLTAQDFVLLAGAVVARKLYAIRCPVV